MCSSSLCDTRYFGTICCFIYSVVCIPSELLSWINTISSYLFLLCWTSLLLPQTIFSRLIFHHGVHSGSAHQVFQLWPQEAASYICRTYPTYLPTYLPACLPTYLPTYLQYTCAISQCSTELFVFQVYSGKGDRAVTIPLRIQDNTNTQNIKTIHVARGNKPGILLFSTQPAAYALHQTPNLIHKLHVLLTILHHSLRYVSYDRFIATC